MNCCFLVDKYSYKNNLMMIICIIVIILETSRMEIVWPKCETHIKNVHMNNQLITHLKASRFESCSIVAKWPNNLWINEFKMKHDITFVCIYRIVLCLYYIIILGTQSASLETDSTTIRTPKRDFSSLINDIIWCHVLHLCVGRRSKVNYGCWFAT